MSTLSQMLRTRPAAVLLTAGIVALTLTTAWIHLGLGGMLFTLNAIGYTVLAAAVIVGAIAPTPFVARFSWMPRVGLLGFAALTIAGYLVMGPYFSLGFITKGIETALIALLVIDLFRVYRSPAGLVRTAIASVAPVLPARLRAFGEGA